MHKHLHSCHLLITTADRTLPVKVCLHRHALYLRHCKPQIWKSKLTAKTQALLDLEHMQKNLTAESQACFSCLPPHHSAKISTSQHPWCAYKTAWLQHCTFPNELSKEPTLRKPLKHCPCQVTTEHWEPSKLQLPASSSSLSSNTSPWAKTPCTGHNSGPQPCSTRYSFHK